ncbi:hypothetical protein ACQP08_21735 [Micromonospora zamorensis]|uniref:hypothetical protein n=1 Tax=Micromonospora zamorensis TaxID=709883 RepID=UPI003D921D16
MIRIRFDDSSIDRTRIAVSPITELVNGLDMVHRERARRAAPWSYTAWVERAREVLRTVPETAPLRVYAQLYGESHNRPTPDVFTPVPSAATQTLPEQLDDLRRTPHAVVREQFAKHYPQELPAFLAPYLTTRIAPSAGSAMPSPRSGSSRPPRTGRPCGPRSTRRCFCAPVRLPWPAPRLC